MEDNWPGDPVEALKKLKDEAVEIGPNYETFQSRLLRLEAIVGVLVKALQIKNEFELAEVRREMDERNIYPGCI